MKDNDNNKKTELSGQMGCYVIVTNRLFVGYTEELGMEKASRSTAKVSSKIVEELEKAKYRITFCRFLLCFI